MQTFTTKHNLIHYLTGLKRKNKTIGFVPTMGALHQGHLSLIQKAAKKNDMVVVSIFVNPTQFNNTEDLQNYPKTIENDTKLLQSVSCDVLFFPSVEEMYAQNIASENYNFNGLEHQMEGKFRPGHFNGVATIVEALFNIVKPNIAYFGKKDFQQLQIIKKMVQIKGLPIAIKGCKIYREKDGLAMSSRNTRLTTKQRKAAPFIYKVLKKVRKKFVSENTTEITEWVANQFKKHPLLELEYFTIANQKTLEPIQTKEINTKYRAFIAVFTNEIRLIDTISLPNS